MNGKTIYWKIGYLVAAFGIYLFDQASKAWAQKVLRFGDDVTVIPNFLNFIYAQNTGVAFSQFDNGGETGRWILSSIAGLAAVFVLYYFWRTPKGNDRLLGACALLLAGITGNLTDRVRLGYVIDFIDVQFGNWHYPTFNVADSAICIGAGLLILDLFFSRKPEAKQQTETAAASSENQKSEI